MLSNLVPSLEKLPQSTVTRAEVDWLGLVRDVSECGITAVMQADEVAVVVMSADIYRKIYTLAEQVRAREKEELAQFSAEFNKRLASFQDEDFRNKVDEVFAAEGHIRSRPKAGPTY
jgi:hypothetical protein